MNRKHNTGNIPIIGVQISQEAVFDHSGHEPLYTTIKADGRLKIENVKTGRV